MNSKMIKQVLRGLTVVSVAMGSLTLGVGRANAQTIASFLQRLDPPATAIRPFGVVNNLSTGAVGPSSVFGIYNTANGTATSTFTNFSFLTANTLNNGSSFEEEVIATTTFTSVAAGEATGGTPNFQQNFSSIVIEFRVASQDAQFGTNGTISNQTGSLLLRVTGTGFITTTADGTGQFNASTAAGYTVNYASDFANLTPVNNGSYSITFNNPSNPTGADITNSTADPNDDFLASFQVDGTGTFAGTAGSLLIPEPTTIGFLGVALVAGASVQRRRKMV